MQLILLFSRNRCALSWEHFHFREKTESVQTNLLMMMIGYKRAKLIDHLVHYSTGLTSPESEDLPS